MSQIAVATGAPTLLKPWVASLAGARAEETFSQVKSRLSKEAWFTASSSCDLLGSAVEAFWADAQVGTAKHDAGEDPELVRVTLNMGIATLRRYAPLAQRYSFGG